MSESLNVGPVKNQKFGVSSSFFSNFSVVNPDLVKSLNGVREYFGFSASGMRKVENVTSNI